MSKTFRDIAIGLFVTIIGGIVVAWIIQEGDRFNTESPPSSTSTPLIITTTPGYPHISIENHLVLPVRIFINNDYVNDIDENGASIFLIESSPAKVRFETINLVPSADYMTGTFENVYDGQTLTITNVVGGQYYFFVRIDNNSAQTCDIVIDDGYVSAKKPGVLMPYAQGISMGYYQLFSNSNVTLYCNNSQIVSYYWGIRPNQPPPEESIINIVQPGSGLLELFLTP